MKSIIAQNITYKYPDGRIALDSVSFEIEASSCVAMIGPNGAGKSTLLQILSGIITGEGQVFIEDIILNKKTLSEIRRKTGLVFQNPDDQLFMPTVLEDIAFGPLNMGLTREEAFARALNALEMVGCLELANLPPHHISIGERKRAAIATILSMEPDILLMDEPTASLDPRSRRKLINILRHLTQTLIIATHDMELAYELCPQTLLMDHGKLIAIGKTEDIMQDSALLLDHGLEQPCSLQNSRTHPFEVV
jgi:cobalt/nickel transport system ATP-binding protein